MFTVIQTDRGASDREIEDGVFRNCGLDVEFRRLELEGEDSLIEACVDTEALTAALAGGLIAGAALDVVSPEPLPVGHPLCAMLNVLITPHAAFMSRVSEKEARQKACLEVVRALRKETPLHVRNPEVLVRDGLRLAESRADTRPAG